MQEIPVVCRCFAAILAFGNSMGRTLNLRSYSLRRRSYVVTFFDSTRARQTTDRIAVGIAAEW